MINLAPSVVRLATPEDYQEIWRLFLQAHNENGIFPLAPEKVEFFIQRAIHMDAIHPFDQGPRGQIVVIGEVGALQAICFVIIGEFWYSSANHLEELLVYVDPEYRQSGHAKSLIEWMKRAADMLGIPVLSGIMSTERTEAKVRLYKRQMPCIGAFFLYPTPAAKSLNGAKKHH